MSSKHSPPRWWRPTYDEECDAWSAMRAAILCAEFDFAARQIQIAMETDPYHIPIPREVPQLQWICWEEVGAQCYTLDGHPITPNMVTHIGMEIHCPTIVETYVRATITSENRAESEHYLFTLVHDATRGLVSYGQINKRAISMIQLVDIDHPPRKLDA